LGAAVTSTEVSAGTYGAGKPGHSFDAAILLSPSGRERLPAAFSWKWVRDFIARMWREILLVTLFLMFSSWVVPFLGMLDCIVGLYPAAALAQFAQGHLWFQLYKLYLQRGGTPIPPRCQMPARIV
jgi:hypothetical protein